MPVESASKTVHSKERFANMIERIGFENVEKAILDSDVLDRKEDIINMEIQKR